jgi:hypothetical protein
MPTPPNQTPESLAESLAKIRAAATSAPAPTREDITYGPNDLLTKDDFCGWAKVPRRTLDQWIMDGEAPRRLRAGRHIRFRFADCVAWAECRYVD